MKTSKTLVISLAIISIVVLLGAIAAVLLGIFLTRASSQIDVYYNGNFKILNVAYNSRLAIRSSAEFSALANEIQTQIKTVYSKSDLSMQFDNSKVVQFRSGSVRVSLIQHFKGDGNTSVTEGTVEKIFRQSLAQVSNQTGSLGRFRVDVTSILFTEISQAQAKSLFNSVSTTILAMPNPNATAAMDTPTTLSSTGKPTISTTILAMPNPNATAAMDTPTTLSSTGKPTNATIAPTTATTTRNITSTPACGSKPAISNKIVGGTDSVNGEWPWQVSLRIGSHVCGASIISDRWLISAAHCFQNANSNPLQWEAYMGSVDIRKGTLRTIKRIINHPNYGILTSNDFDVAVLELSIPLKFSNVIQPICLPSSSQDFLADQSCTITGWGSLAYKGSLSIILQKADVNLIDDNTCKMIYRNTITNRMLCAGILAGGVDSCQGDSGGPLACVESDGTWSLAGIVSFGIECAKPNFPGVYSRVTALRDWVQEQTGV